MAKDDKQMMRSRVASASKEVERLLKTAEREGLNSAIHSRMQSALRNAQRPAQATHGLGRDSLHQVALIATNQEEQTVDNWAPADLREMFLAAMSGEWMDGENDGPYSTLLVERWVKSHPKAIDEYHLTLRSGKIVRYRQFRDLLDRGCFAIY